MDDEFQALERLFAKYPNLKPVSETITCPDGCTSYHSRGSLE